LFYASCAVNVLTEKDFKSIDSTDKLYADLLRTEYDFCLSHKSEILKKAQDVYKIGCNKNHWLNYTCCDFPLLENAYLEYITKKEIESSPLLCDVKIRN